MSCRKQRFHWILIGFLFCSAFADAVEITSVDFKGTGDPSEVTIEGNGPITFEKQDNSQDKQIVLELKDATISKANARTIDTSSFNSKVSLISPYQVQGQDTVKVVIQLKENVSADVSQDGNLVRVKIPNAGGDTAANSAAGSDASTPPPPPPSGDVKATASADDNSGLNKSEAKTPNDNKILDEFVEGNKTQKYIGRPITLQVRDVDVTDVLRLIGEASGFNVVIGEDVKGKVTLSLVDVPWDQALDLILHTLHLGAERNSSILRISTLQSLAQEKLEEIRATKAAEASAPRVTRVFPISYADLADLEKILVKFASAQPAGAQAGAPAGAGAGGAGGAAAASAALSTSTVVQQDPRTNSLVVRDIPENIERMKKLIEILDTQTPQVIIEAKVIEVTEGFAKTFGGSMGLGGTDTNAFFASFAGGNPTDALFGSPGVFPSGAAISTITSPTGGTPLGSFGLSPSVSFIPGLTRLNAIVSWGESENQVKVISSPRTVVLNKRKAEIVQGTPVLLPGTTTVAGVGSVPTTQVVQANISLEVTPTVTNDGGVLMQLKVTKDIPVALAGGAQGIGGRKMETSVLVESGATLVIGGIYTLQNTHTSSGFPFLRKLPILGALFGSENDQTDRSELFFFITPKIVNPKEAGLST